MGSLKIAFKKIRIRILFLENIWINFINIFKMFFSPLKFGCSSVPQSPYVTCLWLCGLNLSVVNIFFLFFFLCPWILVFWDMSQWFYLKPLILPAIFLYLMLMSFTGYFSLICSQSIPDYFLRPRETMDFYQFKMYGFFWKQNCCFHHKSKAASICVQLQTDIPITMWRLIPQPVLSLL